MLYPAVVMSRSGIPILRTASSTAWAVEFTDRAASAADVDWARTPTARCAMSGVYDADPTPVTSIVGGGGAGGCASTGFADETRTAATNVIESRMAKVLSLDG